MSPLWNEPEHCRQATSAAELVLHSFGGLSTPASAKKWKSQAALVLQQLDAAIDALHDEVTHLDKKFEEARRAYQQMNPVRRLLSSEPSALQRLPDLPLQKYTIERVEVLREQIHHALRKIPSSVSEAAAIIENLRLEIDELELEAKKLGQVEERVRRKLDEIDRDAHIIRTLSARPLPEHTVRAQIDKYRKLKRLRHEIEKKKAVVQDRVLDRERAVIRVHKITPNDRSEE